MSECQSDTWHMDAWGDDDPAFLTSAASGASADANRDSDPDAWKVFLTSEAEALLESECAPAQTVTSVDPCHSIYSISSAADVFTEAEPASTASATDLFETVESSSVLPNDPEGKQDAESEDIDMSDMWSFADVLDLGSQQPVPNTTHTDLVSRLQRAQVHSRDARAKRSRKLERKQIGAQSAAASSSHTGVQGATARGNSADQMLPLQHDPGIVTMSACQAALRPTDPAEMQEASGYLTVNRWLFGSDALRACNAATAKFLGTTERFMAEVPGRLSALAWYFQQAMSTAWIGHLVAGCSSKPTEAETLFQDQEMSQCEPACSLAREEDQGSSAAAVSDSSPKPVLALFMRVRQYDETPIRLTVKDESELQGKSHGSQVTSPCLPLADAEGEAGTSAPGAQKASKSSKSKLSRSKSKSESKAPKDVQPCKLFVSQHRWAALITCTGCPPAHVECQQAVPLAVLQTNSAPHIARALHDADVSMPANYVGKGVHIVCSDDFSANHLAELYLDKATASPMVGRLHLVCDVHKLHGIAKGMFDLGPEFISGLIKTCLSLRSGQMGSFRKTLRQVISERIDVDHGEPVFPKSQMEALRHFYLQLFFEDTQPRDKVAILHLLNGDWQGNAVQHFCHAGCCLSEEHSLERITSLLLRVLASKGPRVFPRHKWVGAEESLAWFGRCLCLHNLLTPVIMRMYGAKKAPAEHLVKYSHRLFRNNVPLFGFWILSFPL